MEEEEGTSGGAEGDSSIGQQYTTRVRGCSREKPSRAVAVELIDEYFDKSEEAHDEREELTKLEAECANKEDEQTQQVAHYKGWWTEMRRGLAAARRLREEQEQQIREREQERRWCEKNQRERLNAEKRELEAGMADGSQRLVHAGSEGDTTDSSSDMSEDNGQYWYTAASCQAPPSC
jgi:hypothetical protein